MKSSWLFGPDTLCGLEEPRRQWPLGEALEQSDVP